MLTPHLCRISFSPVSLSQHQFLKRTVKYMFQGDTRIRGWQFQKKCVLVLEIYDLISSQTLVSYISDDLGQSGKPKIIGTEIIQILRLYMIRVKGRSVWRLESDMKELRAFESFPLTKSAIGGFNKVWSCVLMPAPAFWTANHSKTFER